MNPVAGMGGPTDGMAVDGSQGGASSANSTQSALSALAGDQFGLMMMLVQQKMSDMQEAIES
jgi:hypothetical protein